MGNDSSLEKEYLFKIRDKLDFSMVLSIAKPSTLLADRLRCDLNSPIFMFINGLRSWYGQRVTDGNNNLSSFE